MLPTMHYSSYTWLTQLAAVSTINHTIKNTRAENKRKTLRNGYTGASQFRPRDGNATRMECSVFCHRFYRKTNMETEGESFLLSVNSRLVGSVQNLRSMPVVAWMLESFGSESAREVTHTQSQAGKCGWDGLRGLKICLKWQSSSLNITL